MKMYCGACGGERGCEGCKRTEKVTEYTGLTEFFAKKDEQEQSVVTGTAEKISQYNRPGVLLLAADLGTTTLAFVCGDDGGRILASYGAGNPQRKIAADVIGRVDGALHGGKERMTKEIKEALLKGFLFVFEKGMEEVKRKGINTEIMEVRMSVAGNTVMEHLLLGYPVDGLGSAPFSAYSTETVTLPFSTLFSQTEGYALCPEIIREAEFTVFPCFSAFVGGDAVAGAYAFLLPYLTERTEPKEKEKCVLFLDLGTNGEVLLYNKKGTIYGTATAMGCAFEGGRFAYASDLLRLVAEARTQGVLDETGLLEEPYFTEGFRGLRQEDIREFQLAKGALCAGIRVLCNRGDVRPCEVEQVYVAGGLGHYCNPEDLFAAELLPTEFAGKTQVVGNSCLAGQIRYLKTGESVIYWETEMFNLAEEAEFEELFYQCMNFTRKSRKDNG